MRLLLIYLMLTAFATSADTLPNKKLTPGIVNPKVGVVEVCATKWSEDERKVTVSMRKEVFSRYGFSGYDDARCVPDKHGRRCEIDHLISRQLGGADDVRNLWPEPYGGPWNAVNKDRLENRLRKMVCSGALALKDAQFLIANDWILAYKIIFGDQRK